MPQLFTNAARSLLQASILSTDTSLTVEAAKADLFPVADTGTGTVPATTGWFKATLQDASGNIEIVYVRTRAAASAIFSNVMRGQEGTTARDFTAGVVVGLRITAADVQASIATTANLAAAGGAALVGNTPAGNIVATTVQAALNELDSEKVAVGGALGTPTSGVATNLTGTAAGMSIGGNAATATNQSGGSVSCTSMTVGVGAASSSITMTDSDEGNRTIHNNSNQIGFLTQAGGWGAWCDDAGNWTAVGNVTAYSDERNKKNWRKLPVAFLSRLAQVKYGTYERKDVKGLRQIGVSAQSLRVVMPEAVLEGSDGLLSVAYGNAALTACIALAKEVTALRLEIETLRGHK